MRAQRVDLLQAHHAIGRDDHLLHQADQVGAAGQHFGRAPRRRRAVPAPPASLSGRGIFKGFHQAFLAFKCVENPLGRQRQHRHAHAQGVAHGVRDRRAGADHRRLAQADHAAGALAVGLVDFDDDLADVAQARQLVVGDLGVQERAGLGVHDPLFEQRVGDAHDHGAVNLAGGRLAIDHQAHVLHGDELLHLDDAGLAVDGHFGHLHAAHAGAGELRLGGPARTCPSPPAASCPAGCRLPSSSGSCLASSLSWMRPSLATSVVGVDAQLVGDLAR